MTKMRFDLQATLNRDLHSASTAEDRAELLYAVTQCFYDQLPAISGGVDGTTTDDERNSIRNVVAAAQAHHTSATEGQFDK